MLYYIWGIERVETIESNRHYYHAVQNADTAGAVALAFKAKATCSARRHPLSDCRLLGLSALCAALST